ncbi:26S proteasome non-ATPase regulatory subunit 3 homolog A [Zea mays]|uniref:26S proteasome non-ATPase regulatory subunit 3 homolog A n=1 Tax=Zea mays TaxID=4577 RepID=A0A1D6L8E7_MAIZE|nr:26S proteasome non-ATPase regulatory subunit 3 homolog A [Zea mays]
MPKSGCPVCNCFVSYTDDKVVPVAKYIASVSPEDDTNMDVDVVAPISIKHGLLEIEIYCYLLVLIFLID